MSTYKKLTTEQKDEVRSLALAGNHPSDIANHYKVAVSTIHNLKKGWEKSGDKFPDLRGTRGKGKLEWPKEDKQDNRGNQNQVKNGASDKGIHLTVGSTQLNISSKAKRIDVQGENDINIQF